MTAETPAEKYYDLLASRYDDATKVNSAWSPPTQVAKALSRFTQPLDNVLIVGIGTGADLSALPDFATQFVEGVDISRLMLDKCAKKYPTVTLHHGEFMTFTGFARSAYDLIICSGTLEFIADFDGFFLKCARLLAPNGALLLTYEPVIYGHAWQNDAESDTMGVNAEKAGFAGFRTFRRSLHQYAVASLGAKLETIEHFSFIAYKKENVDIIYNFAVCQRKY
jgi:ubiquinone/menaquinone biosynthesis C-methylase UbiE